MLVAMRWREAALNSASMTGAFGAARRMMAGSLFVTGWAETMPSFFYATAAVSPPVMPVLLRRTLQVGHDFSRGCCSARDPRPLSGLIWPEDGCASIA
jgi:hypothetical protein